MLSLFSVTFVNAVATELVVQLMTPANSYSSNLSSTIPFSCNVSSTNQGGLNISNVTLVVIGATANYTNNTVNSLKNYTTFTQDFDLANGVYNWTCEARSQNNTLYKSNDTWTFTLNVPTYRSNNIYIIMNGAGAGLGIFLEYIGSVIGMLLLPLAIVFFIVILIYAIADAIKNSVHFKKK